MIVAGPFIAIPGQQIIQVPISADTYAIAIVNMTPYYLAVFNAGSYAVMAVPPRLADVFLSPLTASVSLTVQVTDVSKQLSQLGTIAPDQSVPYNYYVYLYGQDDPIAIQIKNGNPTGYPYAVDLPVSPYQGYVDGSIPSFLVQKGVNVFSFTAAPGAPIGITSLGAYIYGFDATYSVNTNALATGTITMTGIVQPTPLTLRWEVSAPQNLIPTQVYHKFPFPLAIVGTTTSANVFGDNFVTITMPALGNATPALNVYVAT